MPFTLYRVYGLIESAEEAQTNESHPTPLCDILLDLESERATKSLRTRSKMFNFLLGIVLDYGTPCREG